MCRLLASHIFLSSVCGCSFFFSFVSDDSLSQFYLKASSLCGECKCRRRRRYRTGLCSDLSTGDRLLRALKLRPLLSPSLPARSTRDHSHFTLCFYFRRFTLVFVALLWRGAWALSGSSKQAQIMNRVGRQLAEEWSGEGGALTHWNSIECLVKVCLGTMKSTMAWVGFGFGLYDCLFLSVFALGSGCVD